MIKKIKHYLYSSKLGEYLNVDMYNLQREFNSLQKENERLTNKLKTLHREYVGTITRLKQKIRT